MLKQITNSKECLACKIPCCIFLKKYKEYAPYLSDDEKEKLSKNKMINEKMLSGAEGEWRMKLNEKGGKLFCCCVDSETKKCNIYSQRPLDCQMYPLLLMKSEGGNKVLIAADDSCPIVKKKTKEELKRHAEYMRKFFKGKKYYLYKNKKMVCPFEKESMIIGQI